MKYILFANTWKRVGARLFDFIVVIGLTCAIFFGIVYPLTFDATSYTTNLDKLGEIYDDSGLFIKSKNGNYTSVGAFTAIDTLEELTDINLTSDGEEFDHVNLTERLYNFYTEKYITFGAEYNLTLDTFKTQILMVGSIESNIEEFTYENGVFNYVLTSEENENTTVLFVLDRYLDAADYVSNSSEVLKLNEENRQLMVSTLVLFIPILIGFSLIFDLIIPLLFVEGQSLGKLIFKIGILTKDGYRLKKYQLFTRRISYFVIELVLGTVTFGGVILISYTMMLFNKHRRVIHDYVAGTMVVDMHDLIYFNNKDEENRYLERASRIKV